MEVIILEFIINATKIIFLLGFLVLIHESGHFFVAKLCKIRVNEFAIGFGPTIWKKQGEITKYALRLIPLGGFVSMEGENEYSSKEGPFKKNSSGFGRWSSKYYICNNCILGTISVLYRIC